MEVSATKYGDIILFNVSGRLDVQSYAELEAHLDGWINGGEKWFVGDFTALEFISSIGLRVLLSTVKKLAQVQGRMVLHGLNSTVNDVFVSTGLSGVIPITDSQQSAIAVLTG